MEKIRIAELSINSKEIIDAIKNTKSSIAALTKEQRDLKNMSKENTSEFIKNEAALKTLKSEYSNQTKALQQTTDAQNKMTNALDKEVKSINDAVANNKALKEVRNNLDTSTKEGAASLEAINKKLNENTDFIKDNTSALEQQKQNIGNYPDVLDKMSGGIAGAAKGFLSMAKAGMAFIMTPIGAVIAVLAGAFLLVKNAMDRSETSLNKVQRAFSGFQGILGTLMRVLEPLGEFLIDGLVKGFELVEKGLFAAMEGIAKGLAFLGFDEAAAGLRDFSDAAEQGSATAKKLADAEAALAKAQREQEKIQLDYQKNAEKLRQIRDDESLSMAERMKANEDLGLLLDEQAKKELNVANMAVEAANIRIQLYGETEEALQGLADAQTKVAEIEERITGQTSEQLVNQNSLRKEGADKAKEAAQKKIDATNLEIEALIEGNRLAKLSNEERLAFDTDIVNRQKEVLKKSLDAKLISQEQYNLEVLKLDNKLKEQQDINEQAELERIQAFDDKKRELERSLQDAKIEDELAQKEVDIQRAYDDQVAELENLELTEQEKTDLLVLMKQQRDEALLGLADDYIDRYQQKLDASLDNALASEEKNAGYRLQIASELNGALQGLLGDSIAAQIAGIAIEAAIQAAAVKINAAKAAGVVGTNIAAANASAIATSPLTFGMPWVGVNTATGLALQAKILGSAGAAISGILTGAAISAGGAALKGAVSGKKMFARGGFLQGASHAEGGIHIEAEGGEAIINKNSSAMYRPLLSAINEAGGGVKFAQGGMVGGSSSPSMPNIINYDALAQAMANMPAPIVGVDEIATVSNRVNVIQAQASF